MAAEKTIMLQLRDKAKTESNESRRNELRRIADAIDEAVTDLALEPVLSRFLTLNVEWARGIRLLELLETENNPSNPGGSVKEGARLAA